MIEIRYCRRQTRTGGIGTWDPVFTQGPFTSVRLYTVKIKFRSDRKFEPVHWNFTVMSGYGRVGLNQSFVF